MDEICIVAVSCNEYDFTAKDGKHLSGTSYKVALAHFKGGAQTPYQLEIVKTSAIEFERSATLVGKRCRGSVLYDRFGRFAGISR